MSILGEHSKNTVTSEHRRQYTEAVEEDVEGEWGLLCRRVRLIVDDKASLMGRDIDIPGVRLFQAFGF